MTTDDYSRSLAKALGEAELPCPAGARERALGAAGDQAEGLVANQRPPWRGPLRIAFVCLAIIGLGSLTPPGRALAQEIGELVGLVDESVQPTAIVSSCPRSLARSGAAGCKLVARRTPLDECKRPPVGGDVYVAGISCRKAYGLLSPLGATGVPGLGNYSKSRQTLYGVQAVSPGGIHQVADTGWRCWNAFDRGSAIGAQFLCWRNKAVLSFRFFG